MAKGKKKKQEEEEAAAQEEKSAQAPPAADVVREAVERTVATAAGAFGNAGPADLIGEVTSAARRVRDVVDDLFPPDDVRNLRRELEALSLRVAALEVQAAASAQPPAPAPATAKVRSPRRPPAAPGPTGGAAKRPARAGRPASPAASDDPAV